MSNILFMLVIAVAMTMPLIKPKGLRVSLRLLQGIFIGIFIGVQ